MKTPEQIQEYLRQIHRERESWGPEIRKLNPSIEALIAVRVAEEIEIALRWVLDPERSVDSERAVDDVVSCFQRSQSSQLYPDHQARLHKLLAVYERTK